MRRFAVVWLVTAGLVMGCSGKHAEPLSEAEKRQIAGEVLEAGLASLEHGRNLDADSEFAVFADEFVYAEDGIVVANADSLLNVYRALYSTLESLNPSWHNTHVHVISGDLAVLTGNYDSWAEGNSGTRLVFHGAFTWVFQKHDDQWKVVHAHTSSARKPD
jgi:ketosteroid isomerase-like protein